MSYPGVSDGGLGQRVAPRSKRNPCIVHVDLERSDDRDLRRALEQLARALVGRLDACERIHAQMTDVMRRHNERVIDRHSVLGSSHANYSSVYTGGGAPLHPVPTDPLPAVAIPRQTANPRQASQRRKGLRRAVFISCGTGLTQQQSLLRFLQSVGHRPEVTFLTTADSVDKAEFPNPTAAHIGEALQWLVQVEEGSSVLFHFIGRASGTALFPSDGDHKGEAVRQALAEAILGIPLANRMLVVVDTGHMGTPFELPFSVVAHHAPGGFEMTMGAEDQHSGHVILVSTYSDHPGFGAGASAQGAGVLTAAFAGVLGKSLHPTCRILASTLLAQLEKRLGTGSPIPLLSSNRPFHPESEFDML